MKASETDALFERAMATSPGFRSLVATISQEEQKRDRHLRATSFVYRHFGFCLLLSLLMMGAGAAIIMASAMNGPATSASARDLFWSGACVAVSGIMFFVFLAVRPSSNSAAAAWPKVFGLIIGGLLFLPLAGWIMRLIFG